MAQKKDHSSSKKVLIETSSQQTASVEAKSVVVVKRNGRVNHETQARKDVLPWEKPNMAYLDQAYYADGPDDNEGRGFLFDGGKKTGALVGGNMVVKAGIHVEVADKKKDGGEKQYLLMPGEVVLALLPGNQPSDNADMVEKPSNKRNKRKDNGKVQVKKSAKLRVVASSKPRPVKRESSEKVFPTRLDYQKVLEACWVNKIRVSYLYLARLLFQLRDCSVPEGGIRKDPLLYETFMQDPKLIDVMLLKEGSLSLTWAVNKKVLEKRTYWNDEDKSRFAELKDLNSQAEYVIKRTLLELKDKGTALAVLDVIFSKRKSREIREMISIPHLTAFAKLAADGKIGKERLVVSLKPVQPQKGLVPFVPEARAKPEDQDPEEELKAYAGAAFKVIKDTGEWIDYLILRDANLKKFKANFAKLNQKREKIITALHSKKYAQESKVKKFLEKRADGGFKSIKLSFKSDVSGRVKCVDGACCFLRSAEGFPGIQELVSGSANIRGPTPKKDMPLDYIPGQGLVLQSKCAIYDLRANDCKIYQDKLDISGKCLCEQHVARDIVLYYLLRKTALNRSRVFSGITGNNAAAGVSYTQRVCAEFEKDIFKTTELALPGENLDNFFVLNPKRDGRVSIYNKNLKYGWRQKDGGEDEAVKQARQKLNDLLSGIRVLAIDINGTLTISQKVIPRITLEPLLEILKHDFPVVFVTSQSFKYVYDYVIKKIPGALRKNLTLYANRGIRKITFNDQGEAILPDLIDTGYYFNREECVCVRAALDKLKEEWSALLEKEETKKMFPDFYRRIYIVPSGEIKRGKRQAKKGLHIAYSNRINVFGEGETAINFGIRGVPGAAYAANRKDDLRPEFFRLFAKALKEEGMDQKSLAGLFIDTFNPVTLTLWKQRVVKWLAFKDLIEGEGYNPEEIAFIADQVTPGGADQLLKYRNIICIGVNKDQDSVDPQAIKGGSGLQATAFWLEAIAGELEKRYQNPSRDNDLQDGGQVEKQQDFFFKNALWPQDLDTSKIKHFYIIAAGGGGDSLGAIHHAVVVRQLLPDVQVCLVVPNLKRALEQPWPGPLPMGSLSYNGSELVCREGAEHFYSIGQGLRIDVPGHNPIELSEGQVYKVLENAGIDMVMVDASVSGRDLAKDFLAWNSDKIEEVFCLVLDMGGDVFARFPRPITEKNRATHPERCIKSPCTDSLFLDMAVELRKILGSRTLFAVSAIGGDAELGKTISRYLKDYFKNKEIVAVLDNVRFTAQYCDATGPYWKLLEHCMLSYYSEVSGNFIARILAVTGKMGGMYPKVQDEYKNKCCMWKEIYEKRKWDKGLPEKDLFRSRIMCRELPDKLSGKTIRNNSRIEILPRSYLTTIVLDPDSLHRRIRAQEMRDTSKTWEEKAKFLEEAFG
ncbi:MAG: DUF1152 domain-containing protein, partial [Candidatus Omnitrophica bacterium]|nr:DUF1152 domain-containing protein [Candidatus Omnitrophota bacterium]